MVSGGGRIKPQEDSLNHPVDMVVGTPGRVLQHIEEGNMVYGDIKYVVSISIDTTTFPCCSSRILIYFLYFHRVMFL